MSLAPRLWQPYVLAFAAGCWIMVIELVAARLLGRYVGSTVFIWTAVIGIILAGMSLGNWLGGSLADRHPPPLLMRRAFLAAAVATLGVALLHPVIAPGVVAAEALAWELRIVLLVALLFGIPAILLGAIAPLAAQWAIQLAPQRARAIGAVYAWGSVGNVLGTMLAGFGLILWMGTGAILQLAAGMLLLIGLLVPVRHG